MPIHKKSKAPTSNLLENQAFAKHDKTWLVKYGHECGGYLAFSKSCNDNLLWASIEGFDICQRISSKYRRLLEVENYFAAQVPAIAARISSIVAGTWAF